MSQNTSRILSLDPMTRGFGYVIFDEPFNLAECGFARVKSDKLIGTIARFERLLADFKPATVVFEDTEAAGSRRHHRVRELIETLATLARERGLTVSLVSRMAVVARFSGGEAPATKQMIAQELTRHFPELRLRLPKPRKVYESEHERMSIFDALALAVTSVTK
jgi:hypothetical protein